jgi:hypothetical protein
MPALDALSDFINDASSFETNRGRERRFRGRSSGSERNLCSVEPDGMRTLQRGGLLKRDVPPFVSVLHMLGTY